MDLVKKFERSSKRKLMWFLAKFLKAEPLESDYFRGRTFEKILIIRQHNQMGDMILAIPAFRAVRNAYPGTKIGVISSSLNRDVLLNNPYLDRLFLYDKRNPLSLVRLIGDLRREKYNLVVVLHTVSFSFTSVALAVLSGAEIRVGSTSRELGDRLTGSYLNLTLPLPSDQELERMNESEHNLYPLSAIGVGTADLAPVIVPTEESSRWAEKFDLERWDRDGVRLVVHPGAGKAENIWPPQCHAQVVNELNRGRRVNVVVVEGPRDAAAVSAFVDACDLVPTVVRKRNIGEVAALMRRADLVICNDTGVMHVAASVGAMTLAVFGPTNPERWAPRAENLHVVRAPDGNLAALSPERVAQVAAEILDAVQNNTGKTRRGAGIGPERPDAAPGMVNNPG
jgi:heptosyltransferase-2